MRSNSYDPLKYYTVKDVASIMGLSYEATRMRIYRGTIPSEGGRRTLIPKEQFWQICARMEHDGLIRVNLMPEEYRAERAVFLGDKVYDGVLRGKGGTIR